MNHTEELKKLCGKILEYASPTRGRMMERREKLNDQHIHTPPFLHVVVILQKRLVENRISETEAAEYLAKLLQLIFAEAIEREGIFPAYFENALEISLALTPLPIWFCCIELKKKVRIRHELIEHQIEQIMAQYSMALTS